MERLNNPAIAIITLAAFIALALYANRPHEDIGYSVKARAQIGVILAKAKPVTDRQRKQLAVLFHTYEE